jgi:hypothetical protein
MAERPTDAEELRGLPLGELVKQLSEEVSTLVRQEIELARAEMTQKARRAGLGLGELSGAGIAALFALGALTACVIAALALVMPVWLAALIVAVVYGAAAAVLALVGRRQLQASVPPTPQQTVETIKEDVQWAKTQTPFGKR